MQDLPKLNFPSLNLRARHRGGEVEVWNELRGIYTILTPEEWVRRHVVAYLISRCGADPMRIVEEYAVPLNGQPQRADVVVVDDDARPLALVECKAPDVRIDDTVMAQAVRYNSVLGARYIILTNGLTHYSFEMEGPQYRRMDSFPQLGYSPE